MAQGVKYLPAMLETWVQSLGLEDPLEKERQPTPVFLPGEFHGQRSLAGYSPLGHKELDMTEQLTLSLRSKHQSGSPDKQIYILSICGELVPGTFPPANTKIHRCSSPLYKIVQYFHITNTQPFHLSRLLPYTLNHVCCCC